MAVRVFRSTEDNAPALTDGAGTLVTLLLEVLVWGYNGHAPTGSVTSSGTLVTVSDTAHGFADGQTITFSGANETEYNGDFVITVIDADEYQYTAASTPSATPATGTLNTVVTPLGWTSPYNDTGAIYVFRSNVGHQRYLRVNDNADLSAVISGYEAMTGHSTGTGEFNSASSYCNKAPYTSWGPSAWVLVSNGLIIYFATSDGYGFVFGDFPSYVPSDAYNTILIADTAEAAGGTGYFAGQSLGYMTRVFGAAITGHVVARDYTQLGGAVAVSKTQAQNMDWTVPIYDHIPRLQICFKRMRKTSTSPLRRMPSASSSCSASSLTACW